MIIFISSSSKLPEANKSTVAPAPLFVPSKWESIDPDKAAEEAVTSNRWDLFADPSSPEVQSASAEGSAPVVSMDFDEDVDGR